MSWFSSVKVWADRRKALRDLRLLEKTTTQEAYREFRNLIIEAHEVFERDLRQRAIEIWTHAFSRFPLAAVNSKSALNLLLKLKMHDEAESLLQKGRRQYPGEAYFLEGLAQVAYQRGDREEALRRCKFCGKRCRAVSRVIVWRQLR